MDLFILRRSGRERLAPAESAQVNLGFSELEEAVFIKPEGDWSLFIDDVPIDISIRDGEQAWLWRPRFYAGTVTAELIGGGERTGTKYLLDVSPDPRKVGQELFNKMVREVWQFDPRLIVGEEAAHTSIGTAGELDDPEVRYMRLTTYADDFVRAMAAVRRDPHRALRKTRVTVPFHQVRRADQQTARIAMKSTAALALLDANESAGVTGSPPMYDVPLSEPTFDTAGNRTLAALVMRVKQSIDSLIAAFQHQLEADASDDSHEDLRCRWPRRERLLRDLREQVAASLAANPLRSVSRAEISAAGLTAIAANPVYARAQQLIWKLLRIGYESGEYTEFSAMSPTWAVYEAWCFARLANTLETKFSSWTWRRSSNAARRYGIVGMAPWGTIELHYQKPFLYSAPDNRNDMWSISAHLIPDIVVVIRSSEVSRLIVLDAKYRSGRQNVLDAMRSAHIYHDALRVRSDRPCLSILLLPAPVAAADWLERTDFQTEHQVGALVVSPTTPDIATLANLLCKFIPLV